MRFLLPLFFPFLLILYSSIQPGWSSPVYVQVYANESIKYDNQSIIINRPVRSATGPVTISDEANNEKDFDKLPLEELKKQMEQANEKLTKLQTNLTDSKTSLKKKHDDLKGQLQKDFDDKQEEWTRLDGVAKGMNKELEVANVAYDAAEAASSLANDTFAEFESATAGLATATEWKNKVDGAETRFPKAKQEQTDLKNRCDLLKGKGKSTLGRDAKTAKDEVEAAEQSVRDQQAAIDACTSNCASLNQLLGILNGKVQTAKTALEKANEDVKTLKECPDKQKILDKEVKDLDTITKDPNAVTKAQEAYDEAQKLTQDPKFVGIEETRNKATQKLIQTEDAKAGAEANAKSPKEVKDAKDAARRAELAFGNAEAAKKRVESEIAQLEASIDELDKACNTEQAQVDAMTSAYKERSKPDDEGLGTGAMAGMAIGVLFVVAVIAAVLALAWVKIIKPRNDAAKKTEKKDTTKETVKANSSSGDSSATPAPPTPVAIPIDSTPSVPETASVTPVSKPEPPVVATEIVPGKKEEFVQCNEMVQVAKIENLFSTDPFMKQLIKFALKQTGPGWMAYMLRDTILVETEILGVMRKFDRCMIEKSCQDARVSGFALFDFHDKDFHFEPDFDAHERKYKEMYLKDIAAWNKIGLFFMAAANIIAKGVSYDHYNKDEAKKNKVTSNVNMKQYTEKKKLFYAELMKTLTGAREGATGEDEGGPYIPYIEEYAERWKLEETVDMIMGEDYNYEGFEDFAALAALLIQLSKLSPFARFMSILHWKVRWSLARKTKGRFGGCMQTQLKFPETVSSEEAAPTVEDDANVQTEIRAVEKKSKKRKNKQKKAEDSSSRSRGGNDDLDQRKSGSRKSKKSDESSGQSKSNSDKKKAKKNTTKNKKKNKKSKQSDRDRSPEDDRDDTQAAALPKLPVKQRNLDPYPKLKGEGLTFIPLHNEGFPTYHELKFDSKDRVRVGLDSKEEEKRLIDQMHDIRKGKPTPKYDVDMLFSLFYVCKMIFYDGPRMLDIVLAGGGKRLIVIGDLHGSPDALAYHMVKHGEIGSLKWKKNQYLFLGDYVDRGKRSLDLIVALLRMRKLYPKNVFILRGNHESAEVNRSYGFLEELVRIYGETDGTKLFYAINYMFSSMPLAALIDNKFLAMHGGIPTVKEMFKDMADFKVAMEKITKNLYDPMTNELASKCLWNDCMPGVEWFNVGQRGCGDVYGEKYFEHFCDALGIEGFLCGHQFMYGGYDFFAKKKLVCLFSVQQYDLSAHENNGASLIITPEYLAYFFIFSPILKAELDHIKSLPKDERDRYIQEVRMAAQSEQNAVQFFSCFKDGVGNLIVKPAAPIGAPPVAAQN